MVTKAFVKPAMRAFLLIEVVLCASLLAMVVSSLALAQWQASQSVSQARVWQQAMIALENAAAIVRVAPDDVELWQQWQQQLQQAAPTMVITRQQPQTDSIWLQLTWASQRQRYEVQRIVYG